MIFIYVVKHESLTAKFGKKLYGVSYWMIMIILIKIGIENMNYICQFGLALLCRDVLLFGIVAIFILEMILHKKNHFITLIIFSLIPCCTQ